MKATAEKNETITASAIIRRPARGLFLVMAWLVPASSCFDCAVRAGNGPGLTPRADGGRHRAYEANHEARVDACDEGSSCRIAHWNLLAMGLAAAS
ncbi:MAG TPA: hypothetical protein VMW24_03610 [Sedimentisphaerales bacterium]|nr:hypothetical protein [Sedimentisphaerales bacterium]